MGDNNISEKLKALAAGSNRSATARIREIFEEIEAALLSGVRRKDVHQTLTENGFSISFASFELAIYRIRKSKKMGKNKTPKTQKTLLEKGEVGEVGSKDENVEVELVRPPGLTNTAWSDMKLKHQAEKQKQKLKPLGE